MNPLIPTILSLLLPLLPLLPSTTTAHPSPSPLQKRDITPIGPTQFTIPAPYQFYSASCDRTTNATSWLATSRTSPALAQLLHTARESTHQGSCPDDQLCLDGIHPLNPATPYAPTLTFCSDVQKNFTVTGVRRREDMATSGIPIPYGAGGAGGGETEQGVETYRAVEAVFTGLSGLGQAVRMEFIRVVAQRHECTPQSCVWVSIGEGACEGCVSQGIMPVPEGTSRVVVFARVPESVPEWEWEGVMMWWNVL